MSELIACRTLKYKQLSSGAVGELTVEIYKPYLLEQAMVDFPMTEGSAGRRLKVVGLNTDKYDQVVYGVDSLQSIVLPCHLIIIR